MRPQRPVFPPIEEVRILDMPTMPEVFSPRTMRRKPAAIVKLNQGKEKQAPIVDFDNSRGFHPADCFERQESNRSNNSGKSNSSYPPRQPRRKLSFPPPYVASNTEARRTFRDIRDDPASSNTTGSSCCKNAKTTTNIPRRSSSSSRRDKNGKHSRKQSVPRPRKSDSQSREKDRERQTPRPLVEVSPGVSLPLHGTNETLKALREGKLARSHCFVCDTDIYCVRSANFVLCPCCRVVWPMGTCSSDQPTGNSGSEYSSIGGVGLGITSEELREWTQ